MNTQEEFDEWFDPRYREKLGSHRAPTVSAALKYVLLNKGNRPIRIVETGTTRKKDNWRGDGCMTLVFAAFIDRFGCEDSRLVSVDIDPEAVELANQLIKEEVPGKDVGSAVCSDSIEYLAGLNELFTGHISLLCLDSYDWTESDFIASQTHCLKEFLAAEPALSRDSILLIDDCGLRYQGKGGLLIPHLATDLDWSLVASGYQYVYRKISASA